MRRLERRAAFLQRSRNRFRDATQYAPTMWFLPILIGSKRDCRLSVCIPRTISLLAKTSWVAYAIRPALCKQNRRANTWANVGRFPYMRDCYAISPSLSIDTESEGVGFEPTISILPGRAQAIRGDRGNGL